MSKATGILALFFVLYPGMAYAMSVPEFDSSSYCKGVAETGGGSYAVEAACMNMEKESKIAIQAMDTPERVMQYCGRLAETGGNSYMILQGCIDLELAAKESLEQQLLVDEAKRTIK